MGFVEWQQSLLGFVFHSWSSFLQWCFILQNYAVFFFIFLNRLVSHKGCYVKSQKISFYLVGPPFLQLGCFGGLIYLFVCSCILSFSSQRKLLLLFLKEHERCCVGTFFYHCYIGMLNVQVVAYLMLLPQVDVSLFYAPYNLNWWTMPCL